MVLRFRGTRPNQSSITQTWNALPESIVQVPTLNMFKKGIDDRFKSNDRYS